MKTNRTTSVVLGEMGEFAARMVESGRYGNVSEVLRDALRRLEADELRRQRFVAYLESLPEEEPTPSERESLDRLEAERERGELDEVFSAEEYLARLDVKARAS